MTNNFLAYAVSFIPSILLVGEFTGFVPAISDVSPSLILHPHLDLMKNEVKYQRSVN